MTVPAPAVETRSPQANRLRRRDWIRKPDRLSYARVCMWCEQRDCDSPRCIESHARSLWMVCPDCDGFPWREGCEACRCVFGVVEATAAGANPTV